MNAWTAGIAGSMVLALAMGPAPQSNRKVELESADCSRHNMMFGDSEVAYAVQHATAPAGGVLDVQPDSNGGVRIEKGSGRDYSITACIGAGGESRDEAQRAADAVRLTVDGGRVRIANAPGSRSWSVQLIIEAPEGAQINAETSNGPIGISGVSGTFSVRASNGPINLDEVSGRVTARAANGPINVKGSSGEFDVQTDNGPITVSLTGTQWDGRLEAEARNGPLRVRIPSDYRTGVEISSSRRSPWNCRLEACRAASGYSEGDRSVRIGPDPINVRISTVNGPVTIEDAGARR